MIAAGLFFVWPKMADQLSATATAVFINPDAPLTGSATPVDALNSGRHAFGAAIALTLMAGLMCLLSFREKLATTPWTIRSSSSARLSCAVGAFPVKLMMPKRPTLIKVVPSLQTAVLC